MALPISRNRTYNPGDQIKSQDLNEIQDWLIDHQSRLRDGRGLSFWAGLGAAQANWAMGSTDNPEATVGNPGKFILPITVPTGMRVTAVSAYVKHTTATAGLITAKLRRHTLSSDLRFDESDNVGSSNSTGYQTIVLTNITAAALAAGNTQEIVFDGTATATTRILVGALVTVDWP